MKFYVLASGSKGNCCVIMNHDTKIVIDCGSTQKYLKECFKKIECDIASLDACLITHTHSDHISCLKMFKHLPIYIEEDLGIENQRRIQENEVFQINSFRIETIRLSHDHPCLGYIIEDEYEKMVYITDTGYLKEQHYERIKDADYYVFESNHDLKMLIQSKRPEYVKNRIRSANGHLCNEDCAKHLKKCITSKTKQIELAHISEEANTKEKALSVVKDAIGQDYFGELIAASQFEIINGGTYD